MPDNKELYSKTSYYYVETKVPSSKSEYDRYNNSKNREKLFNSIWLQQKVDINKIIDKFCPNYTIKLRATKIIFKGERYSVSADMVAGYLRVRDEKLKSWVKLDGSPSKNNDETHFKIKRREEM